MSPHGGKVRLMSITLHYKQHSDISCCEISLVLYKCVLRYSFFVDILHHAAQTVRGPGSSVDIVTDYGLDGPGIESRWGDILRTCPDRPWDPSSLLYNGYRIFPGGKKRPGRAAEHSPPLVPRSWRSRVIPLPTLWVTTWPVVGTLCLYSDS